MNEELFERIADALEAINSNLEGIKDNLERVGGNINDVTCRIGNNSFICVTGNVSTQGY